MIWKTEKKGDESDKVRSFRFSGQRERDSERKANHEVVEQLGTQQTIIT